MKQMNFEKIHWKHRLCHGGELRKQRAGRGSRPLSSKYPLHVVMKAQRSCLGTGFRSYKRFFLIQAAGAGTFTEEANTPTAEAENPSCRAKTKKKVKLWKHRPFSRVVKGWRAYQTVRNYLQLNEKEALGEIIYNKRSLKGLSLKEWQALWA